MSFTDQKLNFKFIYYILGMIVTFFSFSQFSYAQFPVNISANNTTGSAQINVALPAGENVITLQLSVFDPDQTNEGTLQINGRSTYTLFGPQGVGGNDNQEVIITIDTPRSDWNDNAANTLAFTYVATAGFEVRAAAVVKPAAAASDAVMPTPGMPISIARSRALLMYQRLTGTTTGIDNPKLATMENLILAGDLMGAAAIATDEPNFYNVTVRDFGARMSTRDESITAPLSDFVASIIGITYDGRDARTLLYDDFYYAAKPGEAPVPSNIVNDMLKSNNHYQSLEDGRYNLGSVLERRTGQMVANANDAAVANPDPSGVLTSRAFMQAHADAGTNRRLVEYTFREFLCIPIEGWRDTSASDTMIRQDVTRFPGGSNTDFQKTCKGCHSVMDPLSSAFALVDFEDGYLKHGLILPRGNGEDQMKRDAADNATGVSAKVVRNATEFPDGHRVTNASWTNNAVDGNNALYFGWTGQKSGSGIGQLGRMIASAEAFPKCMARRTFRQVCNREIIDSETAFIDQLATDFKADGYNLKKLFQRVGSSEVCLGKME